ncbi:MAG: family 78 glycoside hydrolase catalytic domain [Planctomycetota bacterium]|jgi:alpha-L-rhamnosidase
MQSLPTILFSVAVLSGIAYAAETNLTIKDLRCEYRTDPLGIEVVKPRLSWILESNQRGQKQNAYQILVASDSDKLKADNADLWDSGKINSHRSIHIPYAGKPLTTQNQCYWKVRVWDKDSKVTPWSKPARWSIGLLKPTDWKAQWIGLDETIPINDKDIKTANWIWYPEGNPAKSAHPGARCFRRAVMLPQDRQIKKADMVITADNRFILYINNQKVGNGNNFKQAVQLDLTHQLKPGTNILAVHAVNQPPGKNPAGLIAALRVQFNQGDPLMVTTNQNWRVFNKKLPGWEAPEFDDSKWPKAKVLGKYGIAPWGDITVNRSEFFQLPARMLRREFKIDKKVKQAMVYICGLGYYELQLNGQKVGDHVLDPGLTLYPKRSFYITYDVTDQIKQGLNAIGIMLGNSRYFAPRIAVPIHTETYGFPKMLLQMHVQYADGTSTEIISDQNWKLSTEGPIRANNDYDGEIYDARMEQTGWSQPLFDDSKWQTPQIVDPPGGNITPQMVEPIRVTKTIKPIAVNQPQPGVYVYDMGQNMVGWVKLKVKGQQGTRVKLRFAEVTADDGMLYLDNIRSCKVTDIYTLKGKGLEIYEPRFTYHGFRYVELTGFPGKPDLSTIEGCVVHSDLERTGSFSCSNQLINRIYKNILWGVRGNLRSIPTDCPQRDERHGWLGDIANESKAESYDFNVAQFYYKWLNDIKDAQNEKGVIPDVAPPYWVLYSSNVTWPAAYLIIPSWFHIQYADNKILKIHYPAMKKWVDHLATFLKDDIMPRDRYGDWCVPPESPELIHSQDPNRKTSKEVLGTTYYYHNLQIMAHFAYILDKPGDVKKYNQLAKRIKKSFNEKYFNKETNLYSNGTQTSSVLPLAFGMVPKDHKKAVFNNLVDNIVTKTKGHIGTGLIGGQWLMRVLSDNGRPDIAYKLATNKTYPSWGYMIENGATTIWELWNGNTADPAMNSHNHLMLVGDLGIWMYEYLAGIRCDPTSPGFKRIIIRPTPVGDLTSARASHKSIHGTIESDWKIEKDVFHINITVPANSTASVYIPTNNCHAVKESGKSAPQAEGVIFVGADNKYEAVYLIDSGQYSFSAPYAPKKYN